MIHINEGLEKDDVVKDEIKQMQDLKKEPKKGLMANGVSVSVCENDKFPKMEMLKVV